MINNNSPPNDSPFLPYPQQPNINKTSKPNIITIQNTTESLNKNITGKFQSIAMQPNQKSTLSLTAVSKNEVKLSLNDGMVDMKNVVAFLEEKSSKGPLSKDDWKLLQAHLQKTIRMPPMQTREDVQAHLEISQRLYALLHRFSQENGYDPSKKEVLERLNLFAQDYSEKINSKWGLLEPSPYEEEDDDNGPPVMRHAKLPDLKPYSTLLNGSEPLIRKKEDEKGDMHTALSFINQNEQIFQDPEAWSILKEYLASGVNLPSIKKEEFQKYAPIQQALKELFDKVKNLNPKPQNSEEVIQLLKTMYEKVESNKSYFNQGLSPLSSSLNEPKRPSSTPLSTIIGFKESSPRTPMSPFNLNDPNATSPALFPLSEERRSSVSSLSPLLENPFEDLQEPLKTAKKIDQLRPIHTDQSNK